MTYGLACGDVMAGCAATFSTDTKDELMTQVAAHAAADHGITVITPEIAAAVESKITES